jgi:hypothetical protein
MVSGEVEGGAAWVAVLKSWRPRYTEQRGRHLREALVSGAGHGAATGLDAHAPHLLTVVALAQVRYGARVSLDCSCRVVQIKEITQIVSTSRLKFCSDGPSYLVRNKDLLVSKICQLD